MSFDSRNVLAVGFSHLLAPLECRERAAVADSSISSLLPDLKKRLRASEVVLLATCSRLEIYAVSEDPEYCADLARTWFVSRAGAEIKHILSRRVGLDSLAHLFRVAAGLDSWILGESEILGQVKRAYETSKSAGATGPLLNRAFQSAAAAGKSVRAKTGLQQGIQSIGGATALLARSIFGDRRSGAIVVFGAGEAARAAARHLVAKNFSRLTVANRTVEHARELAVEVGGKAVGLNEGLSLLGEAEIAIFSVSGDRTLLTAAELSGRMVGRSKPLFLVDLGLPRNVAPECAVLPGVYLYDLDDLKGVVARSLAGKAGEKEKAEILIAEAVAACEAELLKSAARRAEIQLGAPITI